MVNSKRIFILGAGSSIGHSDNLFPSIKGFFSSANRIGLLRRNDFKLLVEYSKELLGRDVLSDNDSTDIEALFTHLEIEIERRSSSNLLAIRLQLLKLIQQVLIELENKVSGRDGSYNHFANKLNPKDTVITFNWDLLLDNVFGRNNVLDIDKGWKRSIYSETIFDLTPIGELRMGPSAVKMPYSDWQAEYGYYLKAHGSIDWFYCSNDKCRQSHLVFPLLEIKLTNYCSECHESLESLLIPPVLNKVYRQYPFIRRIWNLAAKELSLANEIIIWGYSLPPTDFYSTWLLRQARKAPLRKVVIINPSVINKISKRRHTPTLAKSFVRNFYDVFRGKIEKEDISLYESFDDYCNSINIMTKHFLGDIKKLYKNI